MAFTCNLRTQEVESEGTLHLEPSWATVTQLQASQSPYLKQTNEQTSMQPCVKQNKTMNKEGRINECLLKDVYSPFIKQGF